MCKSCNSSLSSAAYWNTAPPVCLQAAECTVIFKPKLFTVRPVTEGVCQLLLFTPSINETTAY